MAAGGPRAGVGGRNASLLSRRFGTRWHAGYAMSLDLIITAIDERKWITDTAVARASTQSPLTPAEVGRLHSVLKRAIKAKDLASSSNALAAALVIEANRTEQLLQREGILRPSKNGFDSSFCRELLATVLVDEVATHFSDATKKYLETLRHLHVIGIVVRRFEDTLVAVLATRGVTFFKRLFSTVELIFMADIHLGQDRGNRSHISSDPLFWTRENLAEAFSYLTHLVATHFGTPNFNCPVDDRDDVTENALCALVMASHVRRFRDWEVLVDGLGYRMREVALHQYSIESPDTALERAIRLGYVQTEMQFAAAKQRRVSKEFLTLREAAEAVSRRHGNRIVQRVRKPIDRFRFEFPLFLFVDKNFLASDGFFEEEARELSHYSREWMLERDELLDFEVARRVRTSRSIARAESPTIYRSFFRTPVDSAPPAQAW